MPVTSGPDAVMLPWAVTLNAGLEVTVRYVTAPVAKLTAREPVYADELPVVAVPVVGEVCTSVVLDGGGGPPDGFVTVSVYDQFPESPKELTSVPESV